jgi:hypothetical protein
MDRKEQIRQLLKRMASEVGPDYTMLARVKRVDEAQRTLHFVYNASGKVDYWWIYQQ